MSRTKAIICTIGLLVIILSLLLATTFIESPHGVNLFNCLISFIAGNWVAERLIDFYRWLKKNKTEGE